MAHFAKVENGIVTEVIVASQDFINTGLLGDPSFWIQTSYNTRGGVHYGPDGQPDGGTPLRKNFASVGGLYDPINDAFYTQKRFQSWILNEDTFFWEPPVAKPNDGGVYVWNEEQQNWNVSEEMNNG